MYCSPETLRSYEGHLKVFFDYMEAAGGIHLMLDCGLRSQEVRHLLRHTFVTSYLIGGGNLEFLRVFMGHGDYNVTKIYSQLAAESKMLGVDVYHLDAIFFEKGY